MTTAIDLSYPRTIPARAGSGAFRPGAPVRHPITASLVTPPVEGTRRSVVIPTGPAGAGAGLPSLFRASAPVSVPDRAPPTRRSPRRHLAGCVQASNDTRGRGVKSGRNSADRGAAAAIVRRSFHRAALLPKARFTPSPGGVAR